jgi:hypothetical protein
MKINRYEIGHNFEREAREFLKNYFDKVVWLSEYKTSTFDFQCFKNNGEVFYGDAKVVLSGNKPTLLNGQKKADFVIVKRKDKIDLIFKKSFSGNVHINPKDMNTINLNRNTKQEFEKERFALKIKGKKFISQDEFIKLLIKHWRDRP